jgi:hypothetical protein
MGVGVRVVVVAVDGVVVVVRGEREGGRGASSMVVMRLMTLPA